MNVEQLSKELNILKAQGHGKDKVIISVEVSDHEQHGTIKEITHVVDMVQLKSFDFEVCD